MFFKRRIFPLDSRETKASNAGRDPAPTHNLVTGQGLLVDGIAPAVCHRMGRHRGLRGPRAARGSCQRDGPINSPVLFNQRFICFFFLQRFEVESLRPRRQRGIWFELGAEKSATPAIRGAPSISEIGISPSPWLAGKSPRSLRVRDVSEVGARPGQAQW